MGSFSDLKGISYTVRDTVTGISTAAFPEKDGSYLAKPAENRVAVTNQIHVEDETSYPPRIVIDKFQTGDRSQKLSGASFVLYRFPSPEELDEDPALTAETPMYYCRVPDGEQPEFRPGPALALAVTTDADGHTEFADLPDGVYYLLETEAPVDFRKLNAPVEVTVDTAWLAKLEKPTKEQLLAASVFVTHIDNSPKTTLPATGGPGAVRLTGLGPLLLWAGAAGIVSLRRKRRTPGR